MISLNKDQNELLQRKKCGLRWSDEAIGPNTYRVVCEVVTLEKPEQIVCVAYHPGSKAEAANEAVRMLSRAKLPDQASRDEAVAALEEENRKLREMLAGKERVIDSKKPVESAKPISDEEAAELAAEEAKNATLPSPDAFIPLARRGRPPKPVVIPTP